MYYRFAAPSFYTGQNRYELNKEDTRRLTLYSAISKETILKKNYDILDALGFTGEGAYLFDELEGLPRMTQLPKCEEADHLYYYILAEVEDYVYLQPENQPA